MIEFEIEDKGSWAAFSFLTEGRCWREITEKPKWKLGGDFSKLEIKHLVLACLKVLDNDTQRSIAYEILRGLSHTYK